MLKSLTRLSRSLLSLLLVATTRSSLVQAAGDASSSELVTSTPTLGGITTNLTSSHSPSMTTTLIPSLVPSLTPNPATSSATHRVTQDAIPPLFPMADSGGDPPDPEIERSENVFNYYFLILAAFAVFLAMFLWWLRQQRKRRKEQMRMSGQHALAQDLNGWVNSRRWIHGAWRPNQTAALMRREEGLNERGEAPPPYEPKSEGTIVQETARPAQDPESGLLIPMRTLSRDGAAFARPPSYQEMERRQSLLRTASNVGIPPPPHTLAACPNDPAREMERNTGSRPNG